MASEIETFGEGRMSFDEEGFSKRIDDLVEDALHQQAAEQRALTDALEGAREELRTLRELVERRDLSVTDALEARLSGIATQTGLEQLSSEVREIASKQPDAPDITEALAPITGQFESVTARIDSLDQALASVREAIERVDPWKPALEVQRTFRETLAMAIRSIEERASEAEKGFVDRVETAITSVDSKLDSTQVEEAVRAAAADLREAIQSAGARTFDRLVQLQSETERIGSAIEAAAGRLDGTAEELRTSSDETSKRLASSVEETAERMVGALDQTGGRLTGSLEEIGGRLTGSLEESTRRIEGTLEETTRRIEGWLGETSRQVEDSLDEGMAKISGSLEASTTELSDSMESARQELRSSLDQATENLSSSLDEAIETSSARSREVHDALNELLTTAAQSIEERIRLQTEDDRARSAAISRQMEAVRKAIENQANDVSGAVENSIDPFAEQLRRFAALLTQANRRITESNARIEALQESLVTYLARRDEQLEEARSSAIAEVIERVAESLKRKDRVRIGEALKRSEQLRKDRRDAERFRKLKNKGDVPVDQAHENLAAALGQPQAASDEEPASTETKSGPQRKPVRSKPKATARSQRGKARGRDL